MSFLSALSARPPASTILPAPAQAGGRGVGAQLAPASGNVAARLPVVDPVSLYNDNVSLSSQSLTNRVNELATSTVDVAQKFLDTFVGKLFGDAAKGASVRFDAVSVQAQSAFSASASQSGSVRGSAFSLNESASFIGTGQLVTADGQTFDFELEVKYEASASAATEAAAPASRPAQLDAPDVLVLTGKPLPPVKFPGSLNELFKLLGRELQAPVKGSSGENGDSLGGNLSLRLLRLVDRAALLAPRPRAEEPAAAPLDRSKALANSYGGASAASIFASA
ncbi:hypothetical protein CR152_18550 [Massilia violaceinigra]|uniref:Uncharacterized protein n=1 Tax=Massilia violaceinigra TaxID=2045208 RepID=A0A2D2DMV1_9BURK|nr:hypothetical protein [Massilia violaceinigra]ATQ76308.1 hypothetical protein CR152_18550 [Massilia violaceinigra]